MIHCRKKPWESYRNTHVRNLAWCLFSPSLLASPYGNHELLPPLAHVEYQEWLLELDKQPEPLLEHMRHCKSPRLGLVFEHYWHFFWKTQRGEPMQVPLASGCTAGHWLKNLQVNHPVTHKTLGEADFIAHQQQSNHLLHCELAVKFYLGYPVTNSTQVNGSTNLWLGPNCIDRLDIKLEQMSKKQLQLLHNPEAQHLLPIDWQGLPIDSQIILRGQLFYPAHLEDFSSDVTELSDEHLKGYWYYPEALLAAIDKNEEVIILDKADWFCTSEQQRAENIIQKSALMNELQPHLSQRNDAAINTTEKITKMMAARPMMLSIGHSNMPAFNALNHKQTTRHWQEQRRVFVVPNHWPDTSAPSFNT